MLKLYNTLTREKQEFKPIKKKKVGIYSCGPTVYWSQHIGTMFAYIQWDTFIKFLKYSGYKVKWVMNITDVGHMTSDEDEGEDKMEKGARREGVSPWAIAKKYTTQFLESLDLLNIDRPDVLCRATDHIKEQINLIKKIEKNGFTYKTKTGLVFNTSKFPDYNKFAKLNLENQEAGSRVEVDPEKKKPWDFLLWVTNQPEHIMKWPSPWGSGFPGWHIECTAMSTKYLGDKFDIHTGGKEHIPVHHTNEVAQAFGAFGSQTANYWLHNEWLLIDNVKVSKSLGNIIVAQDFVKRGVDPLAFRYLSLTSHYSRALNFSWQSFEAAQTALNNLRERYQEFKKDKGKLRKEIVKKNQQQLVELIENDLNFPQALALVWQIVKDNTLSGKERHFLLTDFDKILNLDLKTVKKMTIPGEITVLAKRREEARINKNWAEADRIREEIEDKGYTVEDTNKGSDIKKK